MRYHQGTIGFMMSIASLLSIKVTSPITHMISSAVRGVAASLLGMWLFHDIITTYVLVASNFSKLVDTDLYRGRASSIAVILLGSIYYTWVKHQESQNSDPPKYERVPMEDVERGTQNRKDAKPE